MCRTVHALLSTAICGIQMLVRVFMTIILMLENLIRMILQTLYNFISFMLQMFSLIPICVVFLVTARLKCFMCGGGGPCPVNRGGACDCLMSAAALLILFFIFRATGVLDKIFYKIGYVQAPPIAIVRFVPTPGEITECSRNNSLDTTTYGTTTGNILRYMDYTTETETDTEETELTTPLTTTKLTTVLRVQKKDPVKPVKGQKIVEAMKHALRKGSSTLTAIPVAPITKDELEGTSTEKMSATSDSTDNTETLNIYASNLTTILYYLV